MFDAIERSFFDPFSMTRFQSPGLVGFPSRTSGSFGMRLDVHETNGGFELSAELPGMRKEDITVDVDQDTNVLTVCGERKQEREESNNNEKGEKM